MPRRYKQKLVLMDAKDPEDFSRRCVADPTLCRSLLRVYILGGGVCTSLEDVGKMVRYGRDVRRQQRNTLCSGELICRLANFAA